MFFTRKSLISVNIFIMEFCVSFIAPGFKDYCYKNTK